MYITILNHKLHFAVVYAMTESIIRIGAPSALGRRKTNLSKFYTALLNSFQHALKALLLCYNAFKAFRKFRLLISTYLLLIIVFISACSVKEQADQLKALEKCTYQIVSADSLYIAGADVQNLIGNNGLNLFGAPKLAFAFLQQKMPLEGIVNLKVTNPGTEDAAINEFEYKVFVKDIELLSGFINRKITIKPNGGSVTIPVKIDRDLYPLISSSANQQAVASFLSSKNEQSIPVTFKIKPGFMIGTERINFPDFISIEKSVSNITLLNYLKIEISPQ